MSADPLPDQPRENGSAILRLPKVEAKVFALDCEFLEPFLRPHGEFVATPEESDFILSMNSTQPAAVQRLSEARRWNKPIAWWTVEDPNWFEAFIDQARVADFVFTTDDACIPRYCATLGHNRVSWLPLACSPAYHIPRMLSERATDFVLSANYYQNQARSWAMQIVVEPLLQAGYSLSLFSYKSFRWPEKYSPYWRGEQHYLTTADQYSHGRAVLGMNNQRSGLDGISKTVMTSMRTFEALACGKPFLTAHSDAYEALGFIHGEHFVSVKTPSETLYWAPRLLSTDGAQMAINGRAFSLAHHTYAHRLERIAVTVLS